jgi:hypothetical protein
VYFPQKDKNCSKKKASAEVKGNGEQGIDMFGLSAREWPRGFTDGEFLLFTNNIQCFLKGEA